ncbi:DegV family protein [Muricomes intestini]|jgi:DegV family protein with EDD domain|uniref:DegV family protein n=2 Tax=Muricomes intestini TaxID=1796634 RepID=UPI000E96D40C|nr:DegV family protein [Lachnospiraceae bacterium]
MNIKITSDSTCDLSSDLLEKYNIDIIPLHIEKENDMFQDGVDIFPEDIFKHVYAGGALCTTSAVNPDEYQLFFQSLVGQYEAVIHINLGSGFSSCYQNACIAAKDFANVFVVDSRNLSTGQGHVVMEAAVKAQAACSANDILKHLERIIPKIRASFLLDRLDYMVKGGRCSSVLALGANLLSLKPCIEVEDGKMKVGKKYRGTLQKCLLHYVEDKLEQRSIIIPERIFVTHTTINPETAKSVIDAVNQTKHFEHVYETDAGCTVSSHCGPGTLGILFIES